MNERILCGIALALLLLSGCASNAYVQLVELSKSTVVYDETIRINNCGNTRESEQIVSREFATTVEFEAGISAGYQSIVQGNLLAKYSEYRSTSRTQRLVASPGTNMEFVLRWYDDVRAGNVQVNGKSGTYEVRIPVSVEQISSRDLGCPGGAQMPPAMQPESQEQQLQATIAALQTQIAHPPIPSQSLRSTATPIPTPTLLLDTPPDSILEVGQVWQQGGLALKLVRASMELFELWEGKRFGLRLTFELTNRKAHTVPIHYDLSKDVKVQDNLGRDLETFPACPVSSYGFSPRDEILESGESLLLRPVKEMFENFCGEHSLGVFVEATNPAVTEVIVSISIADITNARWRIPIQH